MNQFPWLTKSDEILVQDYLEQDGLIPSVVCAKLKLCLKSDSFNQMIKRATYSIEQNENLDWILYFDEENPLIKDGHLCINRISSFSIRLAEVNKVYAIKVLVPIQNLLLYLPLRGLFFETKDFSCSGDIRSNKAWVLSGDYKIVF